MNILVYNSQKPEDVCPKIAEIVAKELRVSDIAYEVEMPDSPAITNAKTVLGDIARTAFGGKTDNLFTVIFKPDKPRPFEIRVSVIRSGAGCAASYLLYTAHLDKDVDAETILGEPKVFGSAKFSGGDAAQKLNANADLIKRANKLARSESSYGPLNLKIQRLFAIFSKGDDPTALAVGTLAKPTSMGMSVSMDLNEFTELAGMIEKLL